MTAEESAEAAWERFRAASADSRLSADNHEGRDGGGVQHVPSDELALPSLSRAEKAALVRHSLAVLERRYPGRSVEVRVVPFGAVQILEGASHRRGTPPAVVEVDADTWLALASGRANWADAEASGQIDASGERSDLSQLLPL